MTQWGSVSKCECACSDRREMRATFLIKSDHIVCSNCGRKRQCSPPIMDVIYAECACCDRGEKTSFVVDSKGNYICTNCGRTR